MHLEWLLRWLLNDNISSKYREWKGTQHFISTLGNGSLVVLYLSVSLPGEAVHISKHHYFQRKSLALVTYFHLRNTMKVSKGEVKGRWLEVQ
jgi:hypothetical protein